LEKIKLESDEVTQWGCKETTTFTFFSARRTKLHTQELPKQH